MKTCRWIVAAVAFVLFAPTAAPVYAQQANDEAIVSARAADITESAKIYGYDLGAGNWTSTEANCAALPDVILMQYLRTFPDGAQSRFTAVVPRAEGRVRIVPVLYHGATPFVPAAANPRNYALFNKLVEEAGGRPDGRVQLGGCYAELTGGDSGPLPGTRPRIAGAPGPTLHLEPENKTSSVTLASRSTDDRYQLWSVSFDKKGRVTKATAVEKAADSGAPRSQTAAEEHAENQATAASPAVEPGWKYIPQAPDPPMKVIPPAPQPRVKMLPN